MANINVLVYSSEKTGNAKIWARNEDNGRVCYGALLGSTRDLYRGLKTEQSKVTVQAMERAGWVKILCVADESFGTVDDLYLKDIVGGVARGLTPDSSRAGEAAPKAPLVAMIDRLIVENDISIEWLGFAPTVTVREPLITIRDLSAFSDADTLESVPVHQIAAAVATVDATWNF